MSQNFIHHLVSLEEPDYWIILNAARQKGLGSKGFSAALRLIVSQWSALQAPAAETQLSFSTDNPEESQTS